MSDVITFVRAFERVAIVAVSAGCIYGGFKLFIAGVTGTASLIAEAKTKRLKLVNASPGLFFSLFGCTLLAITALNRVPLMQPETVKDNSTNVKINEPTSDLVAIIKDSWFNKYAPQPGRRGRVSDLEDFQQAATKFKAMAPLMGADVAGAAKSLIAEGLVGFWSTTEKEMLTTLQGRQENGTITKNESDALEQLIAMHAIITDIDNQWK